MEFAKVYQPSSKLRPYIQCYVFTDIEEDHFAGDQSDGLKIMPSTFTSLVLFFTEPSIKRSTNEEVLLDKFSLSGYNTGPKTFYRHSELKQMVVCFTPIGAQHMVDFPLRDINDKHIPARQIFKNEVEQLHNNLTNATSHMERIALFEAFYRKRLINKKFIDKRIYPLLEHLFKKHGVISIQELADKFYVSKRSIQRLITNQVGINFKLLSRLIRFRRARQVLSDKKSKNLSLTEIAYKLKYFDQAHFNHDFRKFSGCTPKEYIQSQHSNIHFENLVVK